MSDSIATDETARLIASNKVDGTAVYNPDGERLGSIHNFMVNKRTGTVEYAVLQFGGILGFGSDYYPLPWNTLNYDSGQGGYVVNLSRETLESAPHYQATEEPVHDIDYGRRVHSHYGVSYPY
ncbi:MULTISPECIES: PRC-barrel domain-containing protein [unclassified Novosphingobium]|uniref:PRC-barrel domain-containing protein n=1 Tax=unclassified Novosphingobium TaxID=2644732 RepID=UPI0014941178|nr:MULTISPECIES: PRC-barrel domain-containing protein [unclassified Novosphingobium]MBB3357316.1 sporulation protein YlmC with PRC-barrel domain [Novosphingobium sp. BK256]MBB3374022.1 sporulation protein YlmC with PRC-barrel domain [Novosphingobium sp. BK280]MBB3378434.1 sporulation protein YlmC with PRC-barrel domain [Novosphingobium sp. BK258]MBB3419782.1 sporulation protein YlmC with PRC-barrel domain [Novosphingobium sp. BK267]MBB3447897.1 sporulation protein YlmC with PRC-barrel domain [